MEVIAKSVHIIDYDNERAEKKEIPAAFDSYILDLVNFVNSNKTVKDFRTRSQTTEVVANALNICKDVQNDISSEDAFTTVASRLLRKEIDIQEGILNKLGKRIKKGSLIQALLCDEGEYRYLVAKVEHTRFIDDLDFSFKSGFSSEESNIWKTCLLDVSQEMLEINYGRVYLNQPARYWYDSFLELDEIRDDELNTLKAFKSIETVLTKHIRKKSPSDYNVLHNAFIGELRKGQLVSYDDMIQDVVGCYELQNENAVDICSVKEKLLRLPDEKSFDRQFTSIPRAIKSKIKRTFKVYDGIEIRILDYIGDIKETIQAVEENDGSRYIKIRTSNKAVFDELS